MRFGQSVTRGTTATRASTRRWSRTTAVLLACGAALLLSAAPGSAAHPAAHDVAGVPALPAAYPVEHGALTVDGTLAPGNTVTVTGAGFAPGSQAELTVASQPQSLGFFTANGSGTVTARVTIPALDPGSHTLTLTGPLPAGGTLILTADFTVGGALPRTGANLPIRAAVTGLVIAALGALLLVSRRTRRHDWS